MRSLLSSRERSEFRMTPSLSLSVAPSGCSEESYRPLSGRVTPALRSVLFLAYATPPALFWASPALKPSYRKKQNPLHLLLALLCGHNPRRLAGDSSNRSEVTCRRGFEYDKGAVFPKTDSCQSQAAETLAGPNVHRPAISQSTHFNRTNRRPEW